MSQEIKFCKKCVMPNTRPNIHFDKNGICEACNNYEKKKNVNWDQRFDELKTLCEKYRGCNGNGYDCAIAVSGGKDSHVQVHIMKDLLGMNPVLLAVDNFSWTDTGFQNKANISESFGCDMISLSLNRKVAKKMLRKGLVNLGSPTWYADAAIYAYPYRMAIQLKTRLLVYGENVNYEYGGGQKKETYSAKRQIENDVVKPVDLTSWIDDDVSMTDLYSIVPPTLDEINAAKLEPIYMSYFYPWDSHQNYQIAKRYGFRHMQHEWVREGTIENYNQIDSPGYLLNQWFKYPKFGHASATEMASRWIRAGRLSRDEGICLVKKYDPNLDQKILDDFINFVGLTHREFWEIADKWYNRNLFEQDAYGVWHQTFELK